MILKRVCPSCGKPYKWLLHNFLSSLYNTVLHGLSKLIKSQHDLQQEKQKISNQTRGKERDKRKNEQVQIQQTQELDENDKSSSSLLSEKRARS